MHIKKMDTVFYPAVITQKESDDWIATFHDAPEAIPNCDTPEDVKAMAGYVLNMYFDFYRANNKEIPKPSPAQDGEVLIEVTRYELS